MRIHCVVVLVLALCALPVMAQSNDVALWYSSARLGDTVSATNGLRIDDATGYGASFNHFWTSSISTELSAFWLRSDTGIDIAGSHVLDTGNLELRPINLDAQWHFARGSMISPYIGAGVTRVGAADLTNLDLDLAGIGKVKLDNSFTYNGNAGINLNFGHSLSFAADAKYIKWEPDAKSDVGTEKLKLNPLLLSAGLRWRW
jgi:outer membrane protein W